LSINENGDDEFMMTLLKWTGTWRNLGSGHIPLDVSSWLLLLKCKKETC